MADVLVSMPLEQLGLLAREKMKEEVRLINDAQKEIDNLSRNLQAIQAVLPDAEERQVTEVAVRGWLDELKDVSNELDEWITAIDRETFEDDKGYGTLIEKEGEKDDEDTLSAKKVCFSMLSSCFPCIHFHKSVPESLSLHCLQD